jgi:bifunctional DNase/RNase
MAFGHPPRDLDPQGRFLEAGIATGAAGGDNFVRMWVRAAGTLLGVVLAAAGPVGARQVEVAVDGMSIDAASGSPVVRLVEKMPEARQPPRELPIWIGPFEAQAIVLEMHGVPPPRPFTHDLMTQLVQRLGGHLTRVEITDLRDGTYYAVLHVAAPDGKDVAVDARPSDAIALALRLRGPILVAEELFTRAVGTPEGTPSAAQVWGLTVQDLTPDIAEFFAARDARGVLVSDVAAGAVAHDVRRGDVITAFDGRPVASVRELASRAGTHRAAEPVRLSLRRGGRAVEVRFALE